MEVRAKREGMPLETRKIAYILLIMYYYEYLQPFFLLNNNYIFLLYKTFSTLLSFKVHLMLIDLRLYLEWMK